MFPRHKFYCIFIQFLHVFPCKYYAGFFSYCSLHTSTHFLVDWQPGVGILLIHINLCLLVLYLVSKLSCYLTCWVNTSSSWENHTFKSTASSGRVAEAWRVASPYVRSKPVASTVLCVKRVFVYCCSQCKILSCWVTGQCYISISDNIIISEILTILGPVLLQVVFNLTFIYIYIYAWHVTTAFLWTLLH